MLDRRVEQGLWLTYAFICALFLLPSAPPPHSRSAPATWIPGHAAAVAPAAGAAHAISSPKPRNLDTLVARLGRAAPRYKEPLLQAYEQSQDFYRFAMERLSDAEAGDRVSQYLIYLVLEQCRTYLRLNPQSAEALREHVAADLEAYSPAEREQWEWEYQRCQGFANRDWLALGDALGADRPGAETEYGSVWYERAAAAGYPPALADEALRVGPLAVDERRTLLHEALQAHDADVLWQLFASGSRAPGAADAVTPVAWLILACQAGYDCGAQARWYRNGVCADGQHDCAPGESALEHYWNGLPAAERERAWTQAAQISAAIGDGRWTQVPLPMNTDADPPPLPWLDQDSAPHTDLVASNL